jgi:hypothetical protein
MRGVFAQRTQRTTVTLAEWLKCFESNKNAPGRVTHCAMPVIGVTWRTRNELDA